MMQDYQSNGEHQHSTGANAGATYTVLAPGSGLHLWSSKQNKIRALQNTPLQDKLWKVLAFMWYSRPSLSRQEKWQSAVLVHGLALFFPLSLGGEGGKKEKQQ